MNDENPMARTDTDFKAYVCDSLREIKHKHEDFDRRLTENTAVTEDIREIVLMGRGMFKFAYRIGSIIRWIGGVAAASILLYHWLGNEVKGLFK